MATFDDDFPELKIGDVDEIPCSSRTVRGGRAIARRKYPNRAGAKGEDMGREPYTIEYEIPLFAGVDPDDFPDKADALRFVCEQPPSNLEVLDYVLGALPVTIDEWQEVLDATKRDGCVFRITVTEDQLDQEITIREQAARSVDDAEGAAAALDTALEEAGVSEANVETQLNTQGVGLSQDEKDYDAGSLWTSTTEKVLDAVSTGTQLVDQVAAQIDTMRARVNALLDMAELQDPENGEAYNAAILLAGALTKAGEAVFHDAALIVEERIEAPTSIMEVAARLYGSTDRALELLERNPGIDPLFIKAGTALEVAAT